MFSTLANQFLDTVTDNRFRGTTFTDKCGRNTDSHSRPFIFKDGKNRRTAGFTKVRVNEEAVTNFKLTLGLQDKTIIIIKEACTHCTKGLCHNHYSNDFWIFCSLMNHGPAWPYIKNDDGTHCTIGTYSGCELIKFRNHHVLWKFNDNPLVEVVLIALKRSEWDSEELEWLASSGLVHFGPVLHEKESADSVSAEHLDRKVGYNSDDEEYNSDDEFEDERNEASLGHYDGDSSPVSSECGDEIAPTTQVAPQAFGEVSDAPIKDTVMDTKVSVMDRAKALDKKVASAATLPQSGLGVTKAGIAKVGTREFFGRIQKDNGTFCSVYTNSETDKELLNEQYDFGMILNAEKSDFVEIMMLKETV